MLPKPWHVGTGAERVVEGEQPRLRRFVGDAAGAALEPLGEHVETLAACRHRRQTPRRRLRGTRSRSSRSGGCAGPLRCAGDRRPPRGASATSAPPDRPPRKPRRGRRAAAGRIRGAAACRASPRPGRTACRPSPSSASSWVSSPRRRQPRASIVDDRNLEADQEPRACRQLAQPPGDDLGRFADHFLAALPAVRPPDAREQQPHVVVDLGRGADRRARDCGRCSSAGWRWPGRCPRCDRRPAFPSARGTAARRPTATRRSGAALPRRSCRTPATTCPSR